MRDDGQVTQIDRLMCALLRGTADDLGKVLHPDAAIHGFQDGLYIHADRATCLTFARRMSPDPLRNCEVAWVDVRGRAGAACIVERSPEAQTTTFLTFLNDSGGWKVMARTFVVEETSKDEEIKDESPRLLQ